MAQVDITKLNPSSPEIITNQSTINIGTIGHVAHGKTTVVRAISSVTTIKYQKELERNITIRLGYANAKIYECPKCPPPQCYISMNSKKLEDPRCPHCNSPINLIRHISFVDCPGHDVLMATMLNGTAVMDAALLLIAANEPCPQPQTSEHLAAVQIMNLKHIIILQNKIDLISQEDAREQYGSILKYIATTAARDSPIIPISAQLGMNIDAVVEHIVKTIPIPDRNYVSPAKMIVIRSFFTNKAGEDVRNLKGGIAGGSILQGCLKIGDDVEIRPGVLEKEGNKPVCRIRRSKIVSLKADENELAFAVPGGLIGVGLTLDPSLCRGDKLQGQVLGQPGSLPDIYLSFTAHFTLFKHLLGVVGKTSLTRITGLAMTENLMLNVGSTHTYGTVVGLAKSENANANSDEGNAGVKGFAAFRLSNPVCTQIGERIAISRKIDRTWRLIGWAKILKGEPLEILES